MAAQAAIAFNPHPVMAAPAAMRDIRARPLLIGSLDSTTNGQVARQNKAWRDWCKAITLSCLPWPRMAAIPKTPHNLRMNTL
jgi:hypothetical protein